MIIQQKNKSPLIYFLIFVFIIIIFIPLNSKNYKNIFWDYYERICTYDLGSSSIHELFEGSLKDPNNYVNFFKKTPLVFKNLVLGVEREKKLQLLNIDIRFKNFKKLLEDRDSALKKGIGYSYRKVKAEITFKGQKIKAKIRLKGHLSDHWRSKHRMSFRVEVKGDNSILGFKKFSLHKPSARQHPYDQSFQEIQRNLNNISPSHSYVEVIVNGDNWGVMNIEEHLTKELLEKQKFKESIIVEFGNEKHDVYKRTVTDLYDDYRISDPYINVNLLNEKKYFKNVTFRKYFSYISNQNILKQNELYDNDSFSKSLFLSLIWNNTHGLYNQNSRYYFSPYSLKLYPITTDQSFFSNINSRIELPKPYEKIVQSKSFKKGFDKNFNEVKASILNSQEIIDRWQNFFPLDKKINSKTLVDNQKLIKDNFFSILKEANLGRENNQTNKISEAQAQNLMDHIYAKHFENGEIHVYNLTREDVKIKNIEVDNICLEDFKEISINGKSNSDYNPYIIHTDLKGIFDNRIVITTEILNYKYTRKHLLQYSLLVNDIHNPLQVTTDISNFKFFEKIDENNYQIKKGQWVIDRPIIIDKNLMVNKGTELIFSEDSYLIIKGVLKILGEEDEKIILRSLNTNWKGIYVYNGKEKSLINHAIISDVSFLKDGLLNLTGGINFYKSDVEITNTNFTKTFAEDFLNIVHSNFVLDNVKFSNSYSDAFDSDFSNGIIRNSNFNNIEGDAIDFSGSDVLIENTVFKKIRDKAISAGEESFLKITNINVDSVGVGIASKDASNVDIERSSLSNYKLYGLMTYKKKSFYQKPSSLFGENIEFDLKNVCCLRQINSKMFVNSKAIGESPLNVDNLYNEGIMKK